MYTSVFAYPWDVVDETPRGFLASVRERLGVDTISLAVAYHAAKLILPHNPRRRVYYPEDGALYYQPDLTRFGGLAIQPHVGALAREGDVLAALCAAAQPAGLGVIAWTVCLHNTRLGQTYPHYTPRNAFGDPAITYLCPAQPMVRAYIAALAADLAHRYPLRAIHLEAAHHMPFAHGYHHEMQQVRVSPQLAVLLGLCFCPACLALAGGAGVDGARVRAYVARTVDRLLTTDGEADSAAWQALYWQDALDGELGRYMALRAESVAALLEEVCAAVHAVGAVLVHLQEASAVGAPPYTPVADLAWLSGVEPAPQPGGADGLSVLGYFAGVERFTAELDAYRDRIPGYVHLEVGLRPCVPDCASAEELAAKVAHCVRLGAAGVAFYNYGMMPLISMEWVRAAVAATKKAS